MSFRASCHCSGGRREPGKSLSHAFIGVSMGKAKEAWLNSLDLSNFFGGGGFKLKVGL